MIPRKGEEAKPYLAKWTLTKEGQKKYGGWKDDGMDRFCEKAFRASHEVTDPDGVLGWMDPSHQRP